MLILATPWTSQQKNVQTPQQNMFLIFSFYSKNVEKAIVFIIVHQSNSFTNEFK